MSYVFNAEEKEKIIDAVSVCTGMKFDLHDKEYKAVAVVSTNCEPFYQTLSDMIGEKLSGFVVFDESVKKGFKSAKLWLDVAIDANGGNGAYSCRSHRTRWPSTS